MATACDKHNAGPAGRGYIKVNAGLKADATSRSVPASRPALRREPGLSTGSSGEDWDDVPGWIFPRRPPLLQATSPEELSRR
jgi:hypothetical protein